MQYETVIKSGGFSLNCPACGGISQAKHKKRGVEKSIETCPHCQVKISARYESETDIWWDNSESGQILTNYNSLEEADIGSKGIAKVIVIKPGFGNPVDNHYYPSETLSRDFSAFEGVKMYADHQTEEEEKQRPEGSIRQWVAILKNVRFEEGVGIVGDAVIIEPWLQAKLAVLRDKKLLNEMGISIRAAGVITKGEIDGKKTNVVERITRVRSVDFVTEAGAGGGVLLYETEKEFEREKQEQKIKETFEASKKCFEDLGLSPGAAEIAARGLYPKKSETLKDAFERLGLPPEAAEIAAKGRG